MSCAKRVLLATLALGLVACGGAGLPPAGPKPGDVDVGYGEQPRDKTTGAITTVAGDKAGDLRSGGVAELLRGRVAGLEILPQPGGGYRFRLRGVGSINDSPEPLFVVNGVPVEAQQLEAALAGVTRDQIKQIDVLKDVSSTAVYGMRGAGGVVIINTRR